ncbi:MAG: ATP phosphoribosyltransferase [Candidatus Aminicenantes bacterium]
MLKLVIPKGHIFQNVTELLDEAGISLSINGRNYIPYISDPEIEAKIMKPQNIGQLVELGAHDAGFTGLDWIEETGSQVEEIMRLGFDAVKIVAAVPEGVSVLSLETKKVIVATEYVRIASRYLQKKGYDYFLIRTHGATEAYPPQDADMIIDNVASGKTLQDHNLKIVDEIMDSSTCFIANREAVRDKWKRTKIDELEMLFKAVLNARDRVMLEMNVSGSRLEEIVRTLPCMRAPTVSPLYREEGFAVKAAVPKKDIVKLIPRLKKLGATDILEYDFTKVIA